MVDKIKYSTSAIQEAWTQPSLSSLTIFLEAFHQ